MDRLTIWIVLGLMVRLVWPVGAEGQRPPELGEGGVAPSSLAGQNARPAPDGPPGRQRAWWLLLRVGGAAACILALVWVGALLFEDRLVYQPTAGPAVSWEAEHIGAREVRFTTADGVELSAWWHPGVPSMRTAYGPVLLWCHGNAGNVTHRAENLQLLASRGMAALLFDYRGYGKSEGSPCEEGLYEDAAAAYRYLTEERGIELWRIISFGRSLGAAVALKTALDKPVAGLVMESAFESVPAMGRRIWPLAPVAPFARNRYDNLARIPQLRVPLLMVHGDRDRLVPIAQGRRVFEAAPRPRKFHLVDGAGHNDVYTVGGEEYFDLLEEFCRRSVRQVAP